MSWVLELHKRLFNERQAALKNIRPKAWVWMQRMFVKGEAKNTEEGGKTQGDFGLVVWVTPESRSHDMWWDETRS